MKIFLSAIFFLSVHICFAKKIIVRVQDESTKQPLENCTVYFPELHTGTTTNAKGECALQEIVTHTMIAQFSLVGYSAKQVTISNKDTLLTVLLEQNHMQIREVVVSVPKGKLQAQNIVLIDKKDIKTLHANAPASLAEALTSIAGVEQQATGVAIGKPVIRGVTGNRIVTYAQDIRQENQQWGDEHGLGVGDLGIEGVEIIKGPSSLLYGSDALGGVIYFVEERYAKNNSIDCYLQSNFQSNNNCYATTAAYKINKNKVKVNVFGNYITAIDYKMPNSNRATNTRYSEYNFKTALGYAATHWTTNIRYSYIKNNFGITQNNITTESKERNIALPFQQIGNHSVSMRTSYYTKKSNIQTTIGYTSNDRKEFEDKMDTAALAMKLHTLSYDVKWNADIVQQKATLIIGIQGMQQSNKNIGEEVLIPDAQIFDAGLFTLVNTKLKNITLQGGLRMDYRKINTHALVKDTNVIFTELKKEYTNPNFSIGASYTKNKITVRANLSNGFRSPNTSELSSNGKHEGTNRYEIGNSNMKTENAMQLDASVDYTTEHLRCTVNPFLNRINNYIFLQATNAFINNTPVYTFNQKDAWLYGAEAGIHYHPHSIHWLHLETNVSSVVAKDIYGKSLPLIPAMRFNTTIKAELATIVKEIFVNHIYKLAQYNVGPFETTTPSYQIVNVGAAMEIKTKQKPIELSFTIKNIFNQKYIDHLSRFKNIGLYNQGINAIVAVKYELSKNIYTKEKLSTPYF